MIRGYSKYDLTLQLKVNSWEIVMHFGSDYSHENRVHISHGNEWEKSFTLYTVFAFFCSKMKLLVILHIRVNFFSRVKISKTGLYSRDYYNSLGQYISVKLKFTLYFLCSL